MAAKKSSTDSSTPGPRRRGRGADPEETKNQLVSAAIDSLIEDGYRGTTARAIGQRANCNQAAIYYHFGGIDTLLIEALHKSSAERLARYKDALPGVKSLPDMVTRIQELYAEDDETGHLSLLTELTGGITAAPELRAGIDSATRPWVDFVEEQIIEVAKSLSFGALIPARDLADLVFSIVIGVELRNRIDESVDRPGRIFRLAGLAASLVESNAKN